MKNIASFKIFILLPFIMLLSCSDFVEVDLPTSQLTTGIVFESESTANAAMTDVYSKIRDTGLLTGTASGMSCQLGNYADELIYYGPAGLSTENFYRNTLLVDDPTILEWWNSSYNQIYAVNAILEGVENSSSLTGDFKTRLSGESLFLRALLHFYLLQVYGDIPYITTTDYLTNSNVSRTSVDQVYQNIEEDLLLAVEYLPQAYNDGNRTRPNRFAAMALMARVYLYQGKWAEASEAASAVLNQTQVYSIESDLANVFKIESSETIWQLDSALPGENASEATTFIIIQGPPPLTALSEQFMASFENGDLRKEIWTKEITDGNSIWYYPNKYTTFENTGSSIQFSVMLRLSEQYLIRSEARAHQGDIIGAREDLNIIRNTAQLPANTGSTADGLLAAIAHERRVEFFTEHGHRFFDLKRTNSLDSTLGNFKLGWSITDRLLPIPERELLVNPNLNPQNPGY